MWTYRQSTGELIDSSGEIVATGYSGLGDDKNNPADQGIQGHGPIPQGVWSIGPAETNPQLGPLAMPLTPDPSTDTLGRSGFFIHGDSIAHPGQASHGCIILDHPTRVLLSESDDKSLQVTT